MANPFKKAWHWFWVTATLKTKLLITAPIVIVIALLLFWSFKDTRPAIEDDEGYKELAGENKLLREQNAGLRIEMNALEARGDAMELQRDQLIQDYERFGQKAVEGAKIIQQAGEQNAKDIAIIGANNITKFERCQRMCATRAGLGGPCVPTFCDQYR